MTKLAYWVLHGNGCRRSFAEWKSLHTQVETEVRIDLSQDDMEQDAYQTQTHGDHESPYLVAYAQPDLDGKEDSENCPIGSISSKSGNVVQGRQRQVAGL